MALYGIHCFSCFMRLCAPSGEVQRPQEPWATGAQQGRLALKIQAPTVLLATRTLAQFSELCNRQLEVLSALRKQKLSLGGTSNLTSLWWKGVEKNPSLDS